MTQEETMKKMLLVALVLLLPAAAFAEFGVGGVALYNSPVLIGQKVSDIDLNVNKFSFGPDLRYKLWILQLEAMILGSFGNFSSLDGYIDAGLAFDILFLRLSAGIGLNGTYQFENGAFNKGFNTKFNADLKLGKLSLGLTYIINMNLDGGFHWDLSSGLLGATVMWWF
jgi:hypothetical protein